MTVFRTLAAVYSAIFGVVALWAWYVGVIMLRSSTEHLLPDIILLYVSLPASLFTPSFVRFVVSILLQTVCPTRLADSLWLGTGSGTVSSVRPYTAA